MASMKTLNTGIGQAGLSLIELMIALALGLVLTLGVTQIFLGSSQTYRLNDGLSVLQENLRFALSNLQYDSRMAGHYGCLVGAPANLLDTTDPAYDPNVYDVGQISAMGWEADNTGLGDTFTITSLTPAGTAWSNGTGDALPADITGDIVPGTDVLVVNGAEPTNVVLNGSPPGGTANSSIGTTASTNIAAGTVILTVAGDCSGGDLFQKTNNPSGTAISKGAGGTPGNMNPSGGFSSLYDGEGSVYEFFSKAYYIGTGANGEPALFRERLDAGDPFGAVELIAGVESMQVLYGLSNNPTVNRRAERYVPADTVTDWTEVVSIRIALLMRSNDNSVDEAAARTLNLASTQITTVSDRRARLVGVATVGVRNRLE